MEQTNAVLFWLINVLNEKKSSASVYRVRYLGEMHSRTEMRAKSGYKYLITFSVSQNANIALWFSVQRKANPIVTNIFLLLSSVLVKQVNAVLR